MASWSLNLKNCLRNKGCTFLMTVKGSDESRCRSSLKVFSDFLSNRFLVRSPDLSLRFGFPLAPFRRNGTGGPVTWHAPSCGMRMRDFAFLQAFKGLLLPSTSPRPDLSRPSVRLGSGRRRGVEGRGTLSDSSQGLSVPLGLAGSRLRSGGMRGRVCSESTFSGLCAGGLFASAVAGVGG